MNGCSLVFLQMIYVMVEMFMVKMLLDCQGSVYVFFNLRDVLDGKCVWNGGILYDYIWLDDCWLLWCGCGYFFKKDEIKFVCEYIELYDFGFYYCILILVYGEIVGMMYLMLLEYMDEEVFFEIYCLVQLVVEQISLVIVNSKMCD